MIYSTVLSLFVVSFLLLNCWNVGRACCQSEATIPLWPVLLLAGLSLTFLSSYGHLHDWDERYHALVGKHMAQDWSVPRLITDPVPGFDETQWGLSGVWLHKQPFTAWCIGAAMWLFGETAFVARVPSVLFTLLAICCTYGIGRKIFSHNVGVLAAFLHACNGKVLETAAGIIATDHVDTIFVALVELSIFFAVWYSEKRSNTKGVLIGVFCGLAVLTKWLTGLLVLPLLFYLLWAYHRKPLKGLFHVLGIGLVALAVFLPWQVYILEHYPVLAKVEYAYNREHITQALEHHDGNGWFYPNNFRRVFGETIFLVFTWSLVQLRRQYSPERGFLLLWLAIPFLFFSVVATKMSGYLMIAYPAIFLMIAVVVTEALPWVKKLSGLRRYALMAILVLTFALPVRYGVERMKLFQDVTTIPGWQTAIDEFVVSRATAGKKTLVFGDDKNIQLMFADDDVTAYPFRFDEDYWSRIDTNRFDVFVRQELDGVISYRRIEK